MSEILLAIVLGLAVGLLVRGLYLLFGRLKLRRMGTKAAVAQSLPSEFAGKPSTAQLDKIVDSLSGDVMLNPKTWTYVRGDEKALAHLTKVINGWHIKLAVFSKQHGYAIYGMEVHQPGPVRQSGDLVYALSDGQAKKIREAFLAGVVMFSPLKTEESKKSP